jgi:hypothetical protein
VLERTLGSALPIFCYDDLFDNISMYYWDGETEDTAAREALVALHGADDSEIAAQTMPSEMNARRPEWMLAARAAPTSKLPTALRRALRELRDAHAALTICLTNITPGASRWMFSTNMSPVSRNVRRFRR